MNADLRPVSGPPATFNHYRPARYLAENFARLSKDISAATLDRFEAAMKALNALLV
jgi:hypothetical protein